MMNDANSLTYDLLYPTEKFGVKIFKGQILIILAATIGATALGPIQKCSAQNNESADEYRQYNRQGIELQVQGKLEQAAQQYRLAIKSQPNKAAAHNNLALVLKDLNQLEEAQKEAKIAISLKPENPDYLLTEGLVLQKCGNLKSAIEKINAAIKFRPTDPEYRYWLAFALNKQGEEGEAIDQLKMAILVKPNEVRFHRLLADIYMESKRHQDALCEYSKISKLNPNANDIGDINNKIDYLKTVLKPY